MKLLSMVQRRKYVIILGVTILGIFSFQFASAQALGSTTGNVIGDITLSAGLGFANFFFIALAMIGTAFANMLGALIHLVMSLIIIPILGYNNFNSSYVISIGWPLVRDIVNMFVIIVLLVIAIKTMLGLSGGKSAQQHLVRFFLAIVAVNFSRTICVAIIDLGQVVMFTFVNALRDIAAGNIVNMFQLNKLFSWTGVVDSFGASDGAGYMITAYAVVVLMSMILAILGIMAMVFLYRIIVLWVLVIISPVAFFLMGIGDIIPQAKGTAAKWTSTFIGAVTVGPILVFFLWLGLAVAGQGSMAAAEGFPSAGVPEPGTITILSDAFHVDTFLSIIIGMILMIVGFQAASSQASALGGIAGKYINEEKGRGIASYLAKAPARIGANQIDTRYSQFSKSGKRLSEDFGGGIIGLGAGLASKGGVIGAIGRGVIGAGGYVQATGQGFREADVKIAKERVASMTVDQKNALRDSVSASGEGVGTARLSQGEQMAYAQMQAETYLDPKKQQTEIDRYTKANIDSGMAPDEAKATAEARMDKEMADIEGLSKGQQVTLFGPESGDKQFAAQVAGLHRQTPEKRREILSDKRFQTNMLSERAVKDPEIRKELGNTVATSFTDPKTGVTTTTSHAQVIESGKAGALLQAAARSNVGFETSSASEIGRAVKGGRLDVDDISTADFAAPGKPFFPGVPAKGGRPAIPDTPAVPSGQERVAMGLAEAQVDISDFSIAKPAEAVIIQNKMATLEKAHLNIVNGRVKGATKAQMATSRIQARKLQKAQFSLERNSNEAQKILAVSPAGNISASSRRAFTEVVTEQPARMAAMDNVVLAGAPPNQVSTNIATSATKASMQSMADIHLEFGGRRDAVSKQKTAEARQSILVHQRAIQNEVDEALRVPGGKVPKDLQTKLNDIRAVVRATR